MALEIVSLRPLACELTLPHWLPPVRGTLRSLRDDFDLSLTGHFDSATDPRLSRKRQTLAPQVLSASRVVAFRRQWLRLR
jgi:hypothetical protein